jgi:hypothetical protein
MAQKELFEDLRVRRVRLRRDLPREQLATREQARPARESLPKPDAAPQTGQSG